MKQQNIKKTTQTTQTKRNILNKQNKCKYSTHRRANTSKHQNNATTQKRNAILKQIQTNTEQTHPNK